MKNWLSLLSPRQRFEIVALIVAAMIIIGVGIVLNLPEEMADSKVFSTDMSISEVAPGLGTTGKGLARELKIPLDSPKKKPLRELGITQQQLDHATEHILSHQSTTLKYFIFAAILLFGFAYLTRLGRPDHSVISDRKSWYPRMPYIMCLIAAVLIAGFVLGKSPNPMEAVVKVFKSMVGLYPSVIGKVTAFVIFLVFATIGNKLICGWACPFGALQELIYSLPILRKIKRRKLPFWLTNSIRCGLFCIVLLFLFGVVGNRKGFVIYHYLNPFNLFNLEFDSVVILSAILIYLVLAFVTYRPFCLLICPFGFVSWLAERVSLYRVVVDKEKCTQCGACINACPSHAAKGKVDGQIFSADCFSCARCLNVCPVDAISYSLKWSKKTNKTPIKSES